MNIEEAKQNIGKEVVYTGLSNKLINLFSGGNFLIASIHANGDLVVVESGDFIFTVKPQHLQLKHPTYKVGDQVVLDESTKPYTVTNGNGGTSAIETELNDDRVYAVSGIDSHGDGDVHLSGYGWIQPRHLKLAPQLKINGKEIKNFNADGTSSSNPKLRKDKDENITNFVNVSNNYTTDEAIYRKELAMFLVSSGVPLDDIFKARLDLLIDAIHNK